LDSASIYEMTLDTAERLCISLVQPVST